MTTTTAPTRQPWTQRTVEAITDRLSRTTMGRRNFLGRAALVGSALAMDATGFLFRPQSAHASVCGESNECNQGWSAFCATINNGANTCPPGSYTAGWWKIDNSAFCSGAARYIVDCNRSPSGTCTCSCADGDCDRRRVCCNNFRYGQCNTQIKGTTPVVCRVVLCTPPWRFDPACTTTSLTDNRTRTHWSSALPPRTDPTPILVRWTEMGLTGSVLGDIVGSEMAGRRGGRWAIFDNGVMTQRRAAPRYMTGSHVEEYLATRGAGGSLGYLLSDVSGNPSVVRYDNGSTYRIGSAIRGLFGPLEAYYRQQGERAGWMNNPTASARWGPGPWLQVPTASGWSIVHNTDDDRTAALRTTSALDSSGRWPTTARVIRKTGSSLSRIATDVSRETHPDGADTVIVVTNYRYPHVLGVGALAARLDAPVLIAGRYDLPSATADELRRLDAQRAIVIGPGGDISPQVARRINDLVGTVDRFGSTNRFRTNVEISQGAFSRADHVVVTTADDHRLAMTGSSLAARVGGPMLVTSPGSLTSMIADEVQRLRATTATVLGNTGAVSNDVIGDLRALGLDVSRIGGTSPVDTTSNIAKRIPSARAAITDPTNPRVLLVGAALSVHGRMPLLLTDRDGIPPDTDAWFLDRRPAVIKAIGGPDDVSAGIERALAGYPT